MSTTRRNAFPALKESESEESESEESEYEVTCSVDAGDGVTNVMPNFGHKLLVVQPSALSSITSRRNKTRNIEKEEEKEICLHPYPSIVFSYHVLLSTIFVPKLNKFSWVVSFALAS